MLAGDRGYAAIRQLPGIGPVLGSGMLRCALVEAIQRAPAGTRPRLVKDAMIARRGDDARGIAKTAAARILLTQVFYAMRDGHVRRATSAAA